eukprot:m.114922 g.114922  ORF g.114922 m.114922 type:complete len:60 (+) comp12833_c2_seq7:590-769(+)
MENFDDDEIDFQFQSTPGITGFFEVTVGDALVYSKKATGKFPDAEGNKKIIDAINAALK